MRAYRLHVPGSLLLALAFTGAPPPVAVATVEAQLACTITGPTQTRTGQTFRLCAPDDPEVRYVWSGPGIATSGGRCVTVSGLAAGSYEFRVEARPDRPGKSWRRGQPTTCVHRVVVADTLACATIAPDTVSAYTEFRLCAPVVPRVPDPYQFPTYTWSGPGIDSTSNDRCVRIGGIAPGAHRYFLRLVQGDFATACSVVVIVGPPDAACTIAGPASVGEGQLVRLCGPEGAGLGYDWSGPHVGSDSAQRCVTFVAPEAGAHLYRLEVTGLAIPWSCTHALAVGEALPVGGCPRDAAFWRSACAGAGLESGPLAEADLTSIADCVAARAPSLVPDGATGWCAALSDDLVDPGARARRALLVLAANACAAQLGIVDRYGVRLAANGVGRCARDLDAAIADYERLARRAATPGGRKQLERFARCIETASSSTTPSGCGVTAAGRAAIEAASSPAERVGELVIGAPRPNPFDQSTRIRLVLPAGGARVELGVFDLAGRRLATLANGPLGPGTHELAWDGAVAGAPAAAGVYFLRGAVGGQPVSARLLLRR